MKILQKSSLLTFVFIVLVGQSNNLFPYNSEYLDIIFNSNLNTFEVIETPEIETEKALNKQNAFEIVKALFKPHIFQIPTLNERDKRETVFKQVQVTPLKTKPVIDTTFVKKMEIVHGEEKPADHLVHRLTSMQHGKDIIELLSTEFGKKRCIEMLAQPTNDIEIVQQRQKIIEELVHNEKLLRSCDLVLKKMSAYEHLLFDLYQYKEMSEAEKILYFDWPNFANKSTSALSIITRVRQINSTLGIATFAWGYPRLLLSQLPACRDVSIIKNILRGILFAFIAPIAAGAEKQLINATKDIQTKLIGAATYINSIKVLYKLVQHNPIFKTNMTALTDIKALVSVTNNHSKDFNQLNKLLEKSTFKFGDPSVFSSPGNILVAYKLMVHEETRKGFALALNALGELDIYVALAKKIKAYQNKGIKYSFVTFVESNTPYIKATNFWNPFVNENTVITNSIELGGNNRRNIVLTGPNTGGKSTFIKGLMINLLLAQTFGIAPAEELVMTPFANLNCHMNITDDTAGGVSLFKAEVLRAKELMDLLRSLGPNQFAFIIIDEIFTGTEPEKAQELAYDFIKKMSDFENCIFIDATHFKKLTELEQKTNQCKNYHMGVIVDANDHVERYTYKLTEGPSKINNAAQIVQEEHVMW